MGSSPSPEADALRTKSVAATVPALEPDDLDAWLKKNGSRTVTYKGLHALLFQMADHLMVLIQAQKLRIGALEQGNADLHTRVRELEARPALKYCGPWVEKGEYSEGSLTTRTGGLWLATGPRLGTPGSVGSGWQLIVKSGGAR